MSPHLSRDPAARRRLTALAIACFAAMVTGAETGARAGKDPAATAPGEEPPSGGRNDPVAALPLRQQVGQLLILRVEGTERPTYVRDALRGGEAAGAILFADNVASEPQLASLTRSLQRAAGGTALVATDQEGGLVRIVPFAAPEAGPAVLATPGEAESSAREAARDLSRLGINLNLAPVADVASVEGSVMASRAYPGDAERVAELVAAAIRGYEAGGVASTAKHFPGLGAARQNTDDAAVTIERGREQLERIDLPPFRAAIAADVPLVMASHALYQGLDGERIASQSGAILGGLLREELGYEGAVVTDSMEAEAVSSRSATPRAAVRAVEAGADLVLMTSSGSHGPVFERLLERAERSEEFRARVEESARRVLSLKQRMGLESPGPPG